MRVLLPTAACLLGIPLSNVFSAQESAQEPGRDPARQAEENPLPLFELSELELRHYEPVNFDVPTLGSHMGHLVGRQFFLKERGGYRGQPVHNMEFFGTTLLFHDTPEYVEILERTAKQLDLGGPAPEGGKRVSRRYELRNLSASEALRALDPLKRTHPTLELSAVPDRPTLVIHDTAETVAEIESLLEQIDVPAPQFLLQVQLLQGRSGEPSGAGVDPELASELSKLLPGLGFSSIGIGLLQASPSPGQQVKLTLPAAGTVFHHELTFHPVAFDASTGDLKVHGCALTLVEAAVRRQAFETDTVFRGGEYTVLGATGADPILVVVRVTPIS